MVCQKEYANLVEILRDVTDCTVPDVVDTIWVVSKFTSKTGNEHWYSITKVMRYLIRTKICDLFYTKYHALLKGLFICRLEHFIMWFLFYHWPPKNGVITRTY